jgi:transcriptional regulator with XRE-family HTH domain
VNPVTVHRRCTHVGRRGKRGRARKPVASAKGEKARVDEAKLLGRRVRELRCWRRLSLREAAGLAGLSFSFWGQVERGEKAVTSRKSLEAMASALRVHPTELTGQPSTPDPASADTQAGLLAIDTALERYELGVDPEVPVRPLAADPGRSRSIGVPAPPCGGLRGGG